MSTRNKLPRLSFRAMASAAALSCGWAVANITLGALSITTIASAQVATPSADKEATHIQSITGAMQGGVEMVKIDLDRPPAAVPAGFVVQHPARIVLDFPGVQNGLPRSQMDINQGNIKSANIIQAGDRTRVVLNLDRPTGYQTKIQDQSILISLTPLASPSSVPQAIQVFTTNQNTDALPIKDIDFRRGTDNSGRIIVDLSSGQAGVDIKDSGQSLIVDFLKSSLPEGLRRRLDVSDFGTPVQTIAAVQTGDKVRMTVTSQGQWEHSAYQSDGQLVIEVRQPKIDQNKLTEGPGYRGDKLSLNFQSIDIRALLQVIADFTNFNIIVSDTVQGNLTLRLKDVPWDQALDIILQAKSLGMKRNGNVIQIAPKDELAAKEKADLTVRQDISNLEPLRTENFQLNYAKAATIAAQLRSAGAKGQSSGLLSNRGTVIAEPRTNQLFVSDVPSQLQQVEEIIRKLDVPMRQVLIEARIVEASDDWGRSLGVKLGGVDLRARQGGTPGYGIGGNSRVALGANYAAVQGSTNQPGGSTGNSTFVSLPASTTGALAGASSSFAISLFNSAANRFLNLEIDALEADSKGRVISSPHVVTADQTKATISQGTQIPYNSATSSGATSVSFQNAVLSLEVTPQITPDGNIILDLNIHKDTPNTTLSSDAGIPIDTKQIQTQVLVENGGTVVIGGIYTMDESETVQKVPLLGDIPVLGHLFKNNAKSATKTEMLVFITPKMLNEKATLR